MREIKFREWLNIDKENCQMNYMPYIRPPAFSNSGEYLNGLIKTFNILMQFTGQKDKNGKEIWEGDVIQFHSKKEDIREVIWSKEHCSFGLYNTKFGAIFSCEDGTICWDCFEIIGNIYENPELRIVEEENK